LQIPRVTGGFQTCIPTGRFDRQKNPRQPYREPLLIASDDPNGRSATCRYIGDGLEQCGPEPNQKEGAGYVIKNIDARN
jgi:hypothetical protein